jgi:hypothetical protein
MTLAESMRKVIAIRKEIEARENAQMAAQLECDKHKERLSRFAVLFGVVLALDRLGVNKVIPTVGSSDKANLTSEDVEKILQQYDGEEEATTISGSRSWRLKIDNTWELKIYLQDGKYSASVGYHTDSVNHFFDAANWLSGNSPNARNAECFGNFFVVDNEYLAALRKAKELGVKINSDLFRPPVSIDELRKTR